MNKTTGVIAVIAVIVIGGIIGTQLLAGQTQQVNDKETPPVINQSISSEQQVNEQGGKYSIRYVDYMEDRFAAAGNEKRVLFFHASWCPTCKAANKAFLRNLASIPENVVIFKTDYDSNPELKKKYGITYQHTFVQVDENGNEIAKWNGGDLDTLKTNIK
jgi:thioredoxin 1